MCTLHCCPGAERQVRLLPNGQVTAAGECQSGQAGCLHEPDSAQHNSPCCLCSCSCARSHHKCTFNCNCCSCWQQWYSPSILDEVCARQEKQQDQCCSRQCCSAKGYHQPALDGGVQSSKGTAQATSAQHCLAWQADQVAGFLSAKAGNPTAPFTTAAPTAATAAAAGLEKQECTGISSSWKCLSVQWHHAAWAPTAP